MTKNQPETSEQRSPPVGRHCRSQRKMGYGIVLGIVLGALIGPLFDQTVNGMILGFALGMGLGGVLDARNKGRR